MDLIQQALRQQQQIQTPPIQVVSPLNDVQMISLIAESLKEATPEDCVEKACQIIAEAVLVVQKGRIQKLIQEITSPKIQG